MALLVEGMEKAYTQVHTYPAPAAQVKAVRPEFSTWLRLDEDEESEQETAAIEANTEFHATIVSRLKSHSNVISLEDALRRYDS